MNASYGITVDLYYLENLEVENIANHFEMAYVHGIPLQCYNMI